jgi:hypothetical protein
VTKFGILISAVLLASAVAGCGGASTPPSPRAELSDFVVGYIDQNRNNCCELGMKARVTDVTFARHNPHWAFVSMAITDINGKPDGTDFLVAHKIGSTWNVIGFGKGAIGCHVPTRIRAELAVGAPDGALSCSTDG